MKDMHEFDEIARRKLAEREFPFDRSHWTEVERALDERERKPKAWWLWMAAGVLLLGVGAWFISSEEDGSTGTTASIAPPASATAQHSEVNSSVEGEVVQETEDPTVRPSFASTTSANKDEDNASADRAEPRIAGREQVVAPKPFSPANKEPVDPTAPGSGNELNGSTSDHDQYTPTTRHAEADVPGHASEGSIAVEVTPPACVPVPPDATHKLDEGPVMAEAATASDNGKQEPHDTTTVDDPDSTVEEPAPVPQVPASDTPPAPVTTPEAPPAWLAVRDPFEWTALGGVFSTTATYHGEGTGTWDPTTERQVTPGFGLEGVWNFSDHLGLGAGVHFSSYKERLRIGELSTTEQHLTNTYFWTSYDTLVLTVIDTDTIGAVVYNTTQLVPITVHELDHTTDTSYSTMVIRQARTMTNRVNYVEIPVLLDAHTGRGRWILGVRGGPSLGFLTSEQVTLPGDAEGGYMDLTRETLNSITFGCQARLYARYRLSRSWSVGVEPGWKQQMGNALNGDRVQRRANAFGASLSLSYRIQPKRVVP